MKKPELSVDYLPLNKDSVVSGEIIGPIRYSVSEKSHEKTINLIEQSDLEGKTKIGIPYLMPSEMWGLARALSSTYGRLNEVILAKSRWDILGRAFPEEELITTSKILGTVIIKSLPILKVSTLTRNSHGNPILLSTDNIIMLNGLEEKVYNGEIIQTSLPKNPIAKSRRRIYFRFHWNEEKWRNNIHTKDYAQKYGFKEELPEFTTYMDAISSLMIQLKENDFFDGTTIDLKRILPLYKGDDVTFYVEEEKDENSLLIGGFLTGNDEKLRAKCSFKK